MQPIRILCRLLFCAIVPEVQYPMHRDNSHSPILHNEKENEAKMKLLTCAVLFLYLLMSSSDCFAGAGRVVVKDSSGPLCIDSGPEFPTLRISSDEAVKALLNWLHHRPQTVELSMSRMSEPLREWSPSELKQFLEIAFTGNISFCGPSERAKYFSALVEALKGALPDQRALVLVLFHARSDTLLELLEREINAADGDSRGRLSEAKQILLVQRSAPEAYPTQKVVARMLAKLEGSGD